MALTNGMRHGRTVGTASGQWRELPDGNDSIHGIPGNVVSVTLRILKELEEFESHPFPPSISAKSLRKNAQ